MTTLSQKNLLTLAQENEANGKLDLATQNVEEALRIGSNKEIVLRLCDLYLKTDQAYSAYSLIKEEKDLFSDDEIFFAYSRVLQANHFLIEALEIKNLSKGEKEVEVLPASISEQQATMEKFRLSKNATKYEYDQLFTLDLINFTNFAQSLLLDPSLSFAVRLVLCEDLFRLGINESFDVLVLGKREKFIPNQINLLEKDPVYREVVSAIGSRYYHRPSQLPAVLGEVNLILGSLYPKLSKYVEEPDSFASDIASYIDFQDGRSHHDLFRQIDHNLPK